jgi:hypothetical protein
MQLTSNKAMPKMFVKWISEENNIIWKKLARRNVNGMSHEGKEEMGFWEWKLAIVIKPNSTFKVSVQMAVSGI